MRIFLKKLKSFHHRIMVKYLRKKGWVVFYLEKEFRKCDNEQCWLNLYEKQEQ